MPFDGTKPAIRPLARAAGEGRGVLPQAPLGLEESAAAEPRDWGSAAAFALWRAGGSEDPRPLALVTVKTWRAERGGFSARGLEALGIDPAGVIQVRAEREIEALWALEEALKSGAVRGAVGTVEQASLVATRRLDFAAREGRAIGVLLRISGGGDLSAARLRWRLKAGSSAPHPFDPKAPGAARITAELARRRDGPLGAWDLEQDHETHRLRLAAGLADHGLVQGGRTHAA